MNCRKMSQKCKENKPWNRKKGKQFSFNLPYISPSYLSLLRTVPLDERDICSFDCFCQPSALFSSFAPSPVCLLASCARFSLPQKQNGKKLDEVTRENIQLSQKLQEREALASKERTDVPFYLTLPLPTLFSPQLCCKKIK